MEGHHAGDGVDRQQQSRRVAEPHEDLGVGGDQIPVQEREHAVGDVPAVGRDDGLDVRVGEHGVQIAGAILRGSCLVPGGGEGVGSENRIETDRSQRLHSPGEFAVRVGGR